MKGSTCLFTLSSVYLKVPLPPFDERGDLPDGVYRASLEDVFVRFGHGTPQRQLITARLARIYKLARSTGKLERFVIFGSYVTDKPAPHDVDIILIMRDDFRERDYTDDILPVFNNLRAQRELGASIFWTRPGAVLLETVDDFLAHWQIKRDLSRRDHRSHIGGQAMIQNDQELKGTQERIAYFEGLVAQFRVSTSPAEFELMAGAYLADIEKMHAEIMEYLKRHASEPAPAEAA